MKIRESKNLKYDKKPVIADFTGDYDDFDLNPGNCILDGFGRMDDKIEMIFKNRSKAVILAKNTEGGREIGMIADNLNNFIGRSYEEILEADFE